LDALLQRLNLIQPLWMGMRPAVKRLTDFAVAVRYPGWSTNAVAATEAFATCRRLRALARSSLGLKS